MIFYGLIALVLVVIPSWKILKRLGFNGAWSLVCLIPLGALIGLWVLAFTPWPGDKTPHA